MMFGFFRKKNKDRYHRPLTTNEQLEVKGYVRGAQCRLDILNSKFGSDQIQNLIREFIDEFHDGDELCDDPVEAALEIGCLWGHVICRKLQWTWASVTINGNDFFGIVSPGQRYVAFPMVFIQSLLSDPAKDRTSLLLYNMIKAGKLPDAEEDEYLVLS